nr:MAG TPA: tail tape measure [Caudoviricetes sp.]
MTDTTAGRGGVGIRLFVQGGEVVRRTFDQVGDSGKKMWAEIALGEKSANPAIRSLSIGANELKQGFDGLVSRAGSAGTALAAFGVVGLAAAAALGALAIATQGAFEAMNNAADLTDAADRIGVGVEALQQWRYVADEAGVDTATLEGVMEKLNGTIGKFKLGLGDGKLKPAFEELGITKDQLANVQTADQMLLLLADTLGQVKDRGQQVALARTLGVEEALPVIRLGRDELERLTAAASDLGLVLDSETNKRLDESDRKLELAGQQMRIVRDTAVAPLAEIFANVAGELAGMAVEFSNIESRAPGWIQTFLAIGRAIPGAGMIQRAGEFALGRTFSTLMGPGNDTDSNRAGTWDRDDVLKGLTALGTSPKGDYEPRGHTSGRGGGASSAAAAARQREREAEQRRQREERAQQQLERADDDIARSYDKGNLSIEGKAAYEVADLELERAARLREIARAEEEYIRSKGLRGLTEAEGEQLRAKQAELTEQKKAIVEWDRRREIAARRLKDEEDAARSATELLDIDAQMVRTQAERHRIEREILLATIEIARKRKAFELETDPELDDQQRGQQMAIFNRGASRRVELFDHQETERLRAQFKSYGREVTEAIREGRIGEYIGDQLKQRLLDGALDQLFNLFKGGGSGGGSGSGGGNWLSTAFNVAKSFFSKGAGRAAGGDTWAGSSYPVVEHGKPELFMIGGTGHVTSAAETARMLRETMAETGGGAASSAAPVIHMPGITINAPGADPVALKRVEDKVDKLQRDMPGMAVRAVNDARQRNHGG